MKDSTYQELSEFQHVNHFPGSTELTRKDRLWMNFHDMAQTFGSEAFDFVPQTFVLPQQVKEFLECYNREGGLWIVKPHASSRGRGIFVLRDVSELPLNELSVISQYVENPLLIQGLKFDLRVYVLVTGYDPLRAYIYREGLVRFATDPKHLSDAFRHLTNYSINKDAANFVENSQVKADNVGHKWSISALNKHLKCTGVDVDLMWTRIMDLIVKSLLSVEPVVSARTQMTAPHSSNCFELYGFDVLVDADLKPWLLEVNLSPSMQAESPLDWTIKSALLSDALNLVGIDKVDRQTVIRASRSRSEVKRPSYGSGKSGQRPSQVPSHEEEAKVHVGGEQPNAADFRLLEQGQLKTVARALNEMTRVQNFITLFPTEKTVPRYAPITELQLAMKPWPRGRRPAVERPSCSQVMAALLFEHRPSSSSQATGVASRRPRSTSSRPASARPELPARGGDEDADEEAATPASSSGLRLELARTSKDLIRSKRDARARALAMATYPQLAQAATQAGESTRTRRSTRQSPANTVLQQKGCRLMLMEYLIRLDNMCCQLGALELATKIEQIPGLRLGRLQAFQRRLDARHPSQNLAEAESGNFACCIERLLTACRANLLQLVQEVRADAEPGDLVLLKATYYFVVVVGFVVVCLFLFLFLLVLLLLVYYYF
ncbi:unnamed protein product [Polarella glacialis]|uniref:Tubulin--tyrosine ligase-like protein 5 n=1 Tax=Polarella glacialis TaxID=89957 RepID=A0A813HC69_POLGL|nr:unnamed protein product [Polarella glacialis]